MKENHLQTTNLLDTEEKSINGFEIIDKEDNFNEKLLDSFDSIYNEESFENKIQKNKEGDISNKLYFHTMKRIIIIFGVITLPYVALCIANLYIQEDQTSLTYGQHYESYSSYILMITSFGKIPKKYYFFEILYQTITSIILLFIIYLMTFSILEEVKDKGYISQKFSILFIKNPQVDTNIEKLEKFIIDEIELQKANSNNPQSTSKLYYYKTKCFQIRSKLEKVLNFKYDILNHSLSYYGEPIRHSYVNLLGFLLDFGKRNYFKEIINRRDHNTLKERIQKFDSQLKEEALSNNFDAIIFTFSSERFKKRLFSKYPYSTCQGICNPFNFHNEYSISEPPVPEDIIWENIHNTPNLIAAKLPYTFLSGIAIIGVSLIIDYLIYFLFHSHKGIFYEILLSILIFIVNCLIQLIMLAISKIEHHASYSNMDSSLLLKICFFQILQTIITMFFFEIDTIQDFFKSKEIDSVIIMTLFFMIFLYPLSNTIINMNWIIFFYRNFILCFWEKCIYGINPSITIKTLLSQYKMPPKFDYFYRYSYRIFIFWFAIFFAPLFPIIMVLPFLALIIEYFGDRLMFNRFCTSPRKISPTLNQYFILLLRMTYLINLIASIYYYYMQLGYYFFLIIHLVILVFFIINAMFFNSRNSQNWDSEEKPPNENENCCQVFFSNLIDQMIPFNNNNERILRSRTISMIEYNEENGSNEKFKIYFEGLTGQNEYSYRLPTRFNNYQLSNINLEFNVYEKALVPYLENSLYYLNN